MPDRIEKRKEFIINAAFWCLAAAIYYVIFKYICGALTPFVIAFVVTLLLKSPIEWLAKKTKLPRTGAASIVLILFYVLAAALIVLVVFYAIYAAINWLTTLPDLYTSDIQPALVRVLEWIKSLLSKMDPSYIEFLEGVGDSLLQSASDLITGLSKSLLGIAQRIVFSLPGTLVGLLFTIIATIFMVFDWPKISSFFKAQFNEKNQTMLSDIKHCLVDSLGAIIKSYLLIMLITYVELVLGLGLMKIKNFFLISALIAILDILPVLGVGTILIPWSLISLLNGKFMMALELIVLYIIITIIRNIIEPKIVGKGVGINALLLLLSMYMGGVLFGALGIVILPFTFIVLKDLNEKGWIRLYKNGSGEVKDE